MKTDINYNGIASFITAYVVENKNWSSQGIVDILKDKLNDLQSMPDQKDIVENSTTLKMYHLNPNDYDEQWHTIARSKTEALDNILKYLKNKIEQDSKGWFYNRYCEMIEEIKKSGCIKFPDKYTLDEHEGGAVIE